MVQSSTNINFRDNCFNLIRYLAAFQVLIGHANAHLALNLPEYFTTPLGYFHGVPIFFGLSGYLIWNSANNISDFKTYFKKRVLRIYPELWLSVLLSIICILVFYHKELILSDLCIFTVTQSTIFQFWTPDSLRGYGCGTPNGSLWTIGIMVQFYILIYILNKVFKKRGKLYWAILFSLSLSAAISYPYISTIFPHPVLGKLYSQTVIPYAFLFLIGCFICEYKDKLLSTLTKTWWIFGIISLFPMLTGWDIPGSYGIIRSIFLIISIIGMGYALPKLEIKKDLSYGIYLFHMVVINVLISLNLKGQIISLPILLIATLLLAWLSNLIVNHIQNKAEH